MPEEPVVESEQQDIPQPSTERPSGLDDAIEVFPVETREVPIESGREWAESKYSAILSKVPPADGSPAQDAEVSSDAKSIGSDLDEAGKIQKLLDLASAKGVVHAVKVARTLEDDYALDQVHDALANRLYEGLLAKGLISKE